MKSLFFLRIKKEFDPNYNPGDDATTYPFWVASVVGPVIYILAGIHALLWKQLSGVVGSIVSTLMIVHA